MSTRPSGRQISIRSVLGQRSSSPGATATPIASAFPRRLSTRPSVPPVSSSPHSQDTPLKSGGHPSHPMFGIAFVNVWRMAAASGGREEIWNCTRQCRQHSPDDRNRCCCRGKAAVDLMPTKAASAVYLAPSGTRWGVEPAKVGVEGSNPFARSSRNGPKLSPPFSGPRKSPTAASIRALGLGVRRRNVPAKCSPNGLFSPKLGAWPIYSTSFLCSRFNILHSFPVRKIGISFAYSSSRWIGKPVEMTPSHSRENPVSTGPLVRWPAFQAALLWVRAPPVQAA